MLQRSYPKVIVMSDKLVEIAEDSARGGFFLFTGNASQLIVLAIGSIIVARLLGPENYGLLSLSLVIPSILAGLIDLGVNSSLTRFSARLRAEGKAQLAAGMLRSGFLFKLLIGVAMSATCFIFSDALATHVLNRPGMGFLVRIASSLILFQTIFTTLNSAFIGLDRMDGSALIMNAQSVAKTTLSSLLVVLGFSVVGALAGHIAGYMIAGLAGGLIFSRYYKGLGKPSNNSFSSNLRVMLHYGFPLYLSALILLIRGQYQTVILAFFTSNVEIGNLGIATNLSSMMNVLIFPLAVLFPAFSKVSPNSNELKKTFKLAVKYTALFTVPAAVLVATLSKDLVYTLYGHSYSSAPTFLSLYILTFLYTGAGSIVITYLFSGIGETSTVFKCNLINLLVFLPLAPTLTMLYGVPGLIVAFLISGLTSLAYGLFIATKKIQVNLDLKASSRIYLSSFLSAIPLLAFLHISPLHGLPNVLTSGSLFLLTYLTLIPLTGAITHTDLESLKLILSRIKTLWPLIRPVLTYEAKLLSTPPQK
ncbi:MAG: flippase [Candidatus Bathyarchaeia archaeon]